jgi:hypothetical protein
MGMSGGLCGGDTELECPLDEVCRGESPTAPGNCVALSTRAMGALGDPCDPDDALFCAPDFVCEIDSFAPLSGTCRSPVTTGAACNLSFPSACPAGQYCRLAPASASGTCTDLPREGQPCAEGTFGTPSCASGTLCAGDGVCRRPRRLGEPCAPTDVCASGNCEGGVCADPVGCAP